MIESTGISEPLATAETFTFDLAGFDTQKSKATQELKDIAQLDTCVTVVDVSNFDHYFNSTDIASDKFDDIDTDDIRQIFHLLNQQIEFADVILMNKCDLITNEDLERIKRIIRQFNSKAEIITTVNSFVDLRKVINTGKFDFE